MTLLPKDLESIQSPSGAKIFQLSTSHPSQSRGYPITTVQRRTVPGFVPGDALSSWVRAANHSGRPLMKTPPAPEATFSGPTIIGGDCRFLSDTHCNLCVEIL